MKKLRRVTTQVGFTRLSAPSADLQGDYSDAAKLSALTLSQDWLPATEIFGEGVLIRLNEEQVQKWEARDVVLQRALALRAGYIREFGDGADPALFPGIRYFMLHSLSHLLINAMALECGSTGRSHRDQADWLAAHAFKFGLPKLRAPYIHDDPIFRYRSARCAWSLARRLGGTTQSG